MSYEVPQSFADTVSGGNAKLFTKSLNDIVFIDITAFTTCFMLDVFVYGFVWQCHTKTVFILIAL